ncbi:MAG: LamG domain-containing protein [Candidatus Omnitrophota bacterium]
MVKKYVLGVGVMFFVFCFALSTKAEEGLAGWWKFDEGSGEILHDSSGNGNDGKIYGATWVKGKTACALLFDHKDDYVNCGNSTSLQIDGPLTITTWVKVPRVFHGGMIVSKYVWTLILEENYVRSENRTARNDDWFWVYPPSRVPVDKWSYIALVYSIENEEITAYFNGERTFSQEWLEGGIGGVVTPNLYFGSENGTQRWFSGFIGETKIYNRALSAEEIKTNYHQEEKTKDESLTPVIP